MDRRLTLGTRALVRLLCLILACLLVDSPYCEACDRLSVTAPPAHVSVHHPTPAAPDPCNGVCSCCASQGLPIAAPALEPLGAVPASAAPEPARPAVAPTATVFRPPRTPLS